MRKLSFLILAAFAFCVQPEIVHGQSGEAREYAYSQYLRIMGGESDINNIKSMGAKYEITTPKGNPNYLYFIWKTPNFYKIKLESANNNTLWEYNFDGLNYWKSNDNGVTAETMTDEEKQQFYKWIACFSNIRFLETSGAQIVQHTRKPDGTVIANVKLPFNVTAHYTLAKTEDGKQALTQIEIEANNKQTLVIQSFIEETVTEKPVKFPALLDLQQDGKTVFRINALSISLNQGVPSALFIKPGTEKEWEQWKIKQNSKAQEAKIKQENNRIAGW